MKSYSRYIQREMCGIMQHESIHFHTHYYILRQFLEMVHYILPTMQTNIQKWAMEIFILMKLLSKPLWIL